MAALWKDATTCQKAAMVASVVTITGLVSYQGYRCWKYHSTKENDAVAGRGRPHIYTKTKRSPATEKKNEEIQSDIDGSLSPFGVELIGDEQIEESAHGNMSRGSSAGGEIVRVQPDCVPNNGDAIHATTDCWDQVHPLPQATDRGYGEHPHGLRPEQKPETDTIEHQREGVNAVSDIYMRRPDDEQQLTALGMKIATKVETQRHYVLMKDNPSLAAQIRLRDQDLLCEVNGMRVAHWRHDVLVEQFRVMDVDNFELVIRRDVPVDEEDEDEDEDGIKIQFKKLTVCLVLDGGGVMGKVLKDCPATMNKDFQVFPVGDIEREKSCFIEHSPSQKCLHVVRTNLDLAPLQHEDRSFTFFRTLFTGFEDNENHKYAGITKFICAIKVNAHGSMVQYISSQGADRTVALMSQSRVPDDVKTLQADNRFFFHSHPRGSDDDIFESTQNLDWYLAWDNGRLCLKKYDPRNPDIFNFRFRLQ